MKLQTLSQPKLFTAAAQTHPTSAHHRYSWRFLQPHHLPDTSIEKMPRATLTLECPSCRKAFRKRGFLESHLTQTSACRWVLQARAATDAAPDLDLSSPPPLANTPPCSSGENPQFNGYDPYSDNLPPRIPPSPIPIQRETSPSNPPPSAPNANSEQSPPSQNPERAAVAEKPKAVTKHATAGRVYGHSDVVKRETDALRASKTPFAPFSNRIDWEITQAYKRPGSSLVPFSLPYC